MILTKPLPGRGSILIPCNVDKMETVLDPKAKRGAIIQLPFPVLSWEQRVNLFGDTDPRTLNPKDLEPKCREIQVPWMAPYRVTTEHWILDPITYRADNVLRTISQIEDPILIQRSVTKFHDEIAARIVGKYGLLSRHIWSIRIRNSIRLVMTSGSDIPDNYVGIPRRQAQKAKIREGGLVILNRAPTLWQGSVLVLKARIIPGTAGRANPQYLRDLGLDFDGDTCAIFKWPDGVATPSKIGPEESTLPDPIACKWGGTFGLRDLFEESPFLAQYAETKTVPSDLSMYARGLTLEEFTREAEEIALDLSRMKLHIGMVTSIADKICALVDDRLLPLALRAKEKLTQAVLDSKHGEECLDGEQVTAAFEYGTDGDMQAVLIRAGLTLSESTDIIQSLCDKGVPPLSGTFRNYCPEMAVVKGSKHRVDQLITVRRYVEATICAGVTE